MKKAMLAALVAMCVTAAGLAVVQAALGAEPSNPKQKAKADIYEAVLASPDALVKTGSFEPDLSGWHTFGPSGPLAWNTSGDALFGDTSATISEAGDYDLLYVDLTGLTPGTTYYGFGWIKTSIAAKAGYCRLVAAAIDKTDTVVQYIYSNNQRGNADWTLHAIKVVPKADVAKVAFEACCIGQWGADDVAYVDGLTFIEADKVDADVLAKLLAR